MFTALIRILAVVVLVYCAWIIFRVVDDWLGIIAAIVSVVLLPLSAMVMPVVMLFIPSSAAGPLALWPGVIAIGFLDWLAKKLGGSLLIR